MINKNGFPVLDKGNKKPSPGKVKIVKKGEPVKKVKQETEIKSTPSNLVRKKIFNKEPFIPTFIDKPKNVEDTIQDIRQRKDFKSLFSPMQFPEIKGFQSTLSRIIPEFDSSKITKNVVHQLKLMAYFKELKGKDRKYYPKDSDKIKIIQLAIIQDLVEVTDYDFYDILQKLKNSTKNGYFLQTIHGLEDIKITMDNYSLVDHVINFDHYDIVIKYHRTLVKPVIVNILNQVLLEIDKTRLPQLNNSEFDKIKLVFNIIGKMGLNYCNSRSNLEWVIYNKTLRKARNFFSKSSYDNFSKVVCDTINYHIKNDTFEQTLYGFDKILKPYIAKQIEKQIAKKQK